MAEVAIISKIPPVDTFTGIKSDVGPEVIIDSYYLNGELIRKHTYSRFGHTWHDEKNDSDHTYDAGGTVLDENYNDGVYHGVVTTCFDRHHRVVDAYDAGRIIRTDCFVDDKLVSNDWSEFCAQYHLPI